jgi:hypothetical protein
MLNAHLFPRSQKLGNIDDSQYLDGGDSLLGLCSSYVSPRKAHHLCCIASSGIDPMHCTTHALMSRSWEDVRVGGLSLTNVF